MLSPIFDAFVEASPVSVMMRVLMEKIFNPTRMNQLFETSSVRQYSQELLFSTIVDLMSLVVCGMYPSVHAAYQKKAVEVSVSATALYNKLQRIELPVSRAVHGLDKIDVGLSDFYLVDDIHGIYRGMMIAIPPVHWQCFDDFTDIQMLDVGEHLASKVHLKSFRKHPRSPKKKRPPLSIDGKHPHCSTARKLKQYKATLDAIP